MKDESGDGELGSDPCQPQYPIDIMEYEIGKYILAKLNVSAAFGYIKILTLFHNSIFKVILSRKNTYCSKEACLTDATTHVSKPSSFFRSNNINFRSKNPAHRPTQDRCKKFTFLRKTPQKAAFYPSIFINSSSYFIQFK